MTEAAVHGASSAVFSDLMVSKAQTEQIFRKKRDSEEKAQETLLFGDWILNFNPSNVAGEKPISFLTSGEIGEGRNSNEFRWVLRDHILEISRANGDLQNRFRYDAGADRFSYLADAVAKGNKDQFIYRPKSLTSG